MRWSDLQPDPALIRALEQADDLDTRAAAIEENTRVLKNKWSNRFADACARMVATEISRHSRFVKSDVRPNEETKAEPVAFFAGGSSKNIDVIVSDVGVGLRVGVSLKGMNFRDRKNQNFDKNLTGRTYEIQDEVRVVHRTLPLAFMVGLYFIPLGATVDKRPSSFGRTVQHLRARVGRSDPWSATQSERMDMAAVAIYVPGDDESFEVTKRGEATQFSYADALPKGVVRYFDIQNAPPRHGLPQLDMTYDLPGFVACVAERYDEFVSGGEEVWSEPSDR